MPVEENSSKSPLMSALEKFEATEANIAKLERLWSELESLVPSGISFGDDPDYDDKIHAYSLLLDALPMIDGWKPTMSPWTLNEIAQNRLDARELGEPEVFFQIEEGIVQPGKEIRDYRFRFNIKRRALIRDTLVELIDEVDSDLRILRQKINEREPGIRLESELWADIRRHISEIEVLLGSSVPKPPRWTDMLRHIHFGELQDLGDIERRDWPSIKAALHKGLYGADDPLPVEVKDLGELVATKPSGSIATKLNWSSLEDAEYERLLFVLRLMQTRAPDRGRDLSVTRTTTDALSGTLHQRVVIQCKHWQTKSVSLKDAASAKEQMSLWTNPRVDVLIIATSGRFTLDAVDWIEGHNATGASPRIEMWPESHLEHLLSSRPALIAEFKLR